jgi:ABC-type branched-subunit amino acid transport system permease subunit
LFSWSPPWLCWCCRWCCKASGNAWVRIADMALLYVLLALGLNIVVGYAGLLDLGYVAFFAVGAYMFGLLASPHLTEAFPGLPRPSRTGCTRRCGWSFRWGRAGGIVRHAAGRAHAEAARRLPGHRHAGLSAKSSACS